VKSDRKSDSVEQRTWSGFPVKPLVQTVHYSRSHVHSGYNLPSCLPIYLRATYQVIEILQAKMELMRPFQMRYMCIWNQGLSKTEQEMSGSFRVPRLLFH
jgi:hypothetical protein